jgi:hypothetical protein
LRTGLKFGSNCPLLQISVVRDVVSLEIRLAVSKEPKSYCFFHPSEKTAVCCIWRQVYNSPNLPFVHAVCLYVCYGSVNKNTHFPKQ